MQNQTVMGWHTMLDLIAAGLNGEFPKRADLFPKNAALYGVDLEQPEEVTHETISPPGPIQHTVAVRAHPARPDRTHLGFLSADGKKRGEWFASGDHADQVGRELRHALQAQHPVAQPGAAAGKIHRDGQDRPSIPTMCCWRTSRRTGLAFTFGPEGRDAIRKWNSA